MDELIISLIIPVYNVEKYLSRCLDSVRRQNQDNFECILIDDGSIDESGKICDHYAKIDSRFRVFHKINGGVSSARNMGIRVARGKYIVFCDSDDELGADYLSSFMVEEFDLVIAGVKNIEVDGRIHYGVMPQEKDILLIKQQDICEMIENRSLNCIYSKRFVKKYIADNNIQFADDLSLGEDTLFLSTYLSVCRTIKYIPVCHYFYYRYDSQTLSSFDEKYVDRLREANERICCILSSRYKGIANTTSWKKRKWDVYYFAVFSVLRDKNICTRKKHRMIKYITEIEEYKQFCNNLKFYMNNDSLVWRKVMAIGKPIYILILWYMVQLKDKIKLRIKK